MRDFESSFSEFIDSDEYDKAEAALFDVVRAAFNAGWRTSREEIIGSRNAKVFVQPKQKAISKNSQNAQKTVRKGKV